jgi:hypothetical protein
VSIYKEDVDLNGSCISMYSQINDVNRADVYVEKLLEQLNYGETLLK